MFPRHGANHDIWYSPITGELFPDPRHGGKEVPWGLERKARKVLGGLAPASLLHTKKDCFIKRLSRYSAGSFIHKKRKVYESYCNHGKGKRWVLLMLCRGGSAGFGLAGYGDTAEDAKADMLKAYEDIKEMKVAEGTDVPELEFTYKYDLQSFFNYFSFLNVTKVAEAAGINPSLMRQYTSGVTAAGQKQYDKNTNGCGKE